ncbi:hypothetical protein MTAT_20500 [Moorella thermoacetica]|uniref:Uncharacterized protein n=1 Tax=Neomoorella thermoacetica TaxID=1525 RepID=A0AAC9MVC5_NEOTH|nr:hypothetical protein [Moorella thermoacetica]AOQ24705.1 hypothetical protein Maut_02277 [Moorella thermoacetica]TYL12808.1 hypothetical protein MTAT_20500 [Moorella thermoacetica]
MPDSIDIIPPKSGVVLRDNSDYRFYGYHELFPKPQGVLPAQLTVDGTSIKVVLNTALEPNCEYIVVAKDLKGVDGAALDAPVVTVFLGPLKPFYCTVHDVLQEMGQLAPAFGQMSVALAIRNASKRADYLSPNKIDAVNIPYAVSQFVRYRAAYDLLTNFYLDKVAQAGQSYQLDKLHVAYNRPYLDELTKKIKEEMDMWEVAFRGKPKAKAVVRGGAYNPITSRNF